MNRRLNKKGILFSLISVLFSILFITIYSQNFSTVIEDRIPGSNVRIKVMDIHTKDFEKYIGDSIKTSTYRTLDAITVYRYNNGKFFADFESFNNTFYNCMMCGYINCSNLTVNNCSLDQEYFKARLDRSIALSMQQLNIKTEYNINSIYVTQNQPFEIEVGINISYNISDNSSADYYARWNKQKVIVQSVPIVGLLDPEGYLGDLNHTYQRHIIKYSGMCEFDETCWNHTTTTQFYQERSFRRYSGGVSFLQRYWNEDTASECCGIESIIHPSELNPEDEENSYIDHYYWDSMHTCTNGETIVSVAFGSDDVHLDENTASRYGLSGVDYCRP